MWKEGGKKRTWNSFFFGSVLLFTANVKLTARVLVGSDFMSGLNATRAQQANDAEADEQVGRYD